MSSTVRMSGEVQFAVAVFSAVHSNNYARFFNALRRASYLQAAIMHRYFDQVLKAGLRFLIITIKLAPNYTPSHAGSG